VAGLGYTVIALLIIFFGGVGTLSGGIVGAIVYRLLDFGLRRYLGEGASFVNGAIYVYRAIPSVWHCRYLSHQIMEYPGWI
jgi:ABC-type branched-subunit amino acid transport system permease subunit